MGDLELLQRLEPGSATGESICFSREVSHSDDFVGVSHGRRAASPASNSGDGFFRPEIGGDPWEFPHTSELAGVLHGRRAATPASGVGDGHFRPASTGRVQPPGFKAIAEALWLQCSRLPPHRPKWFRPR
jgi:hypothetical protein